MFNAFLPTILELMSKVSGQPVSSEWELKVRLLLQAGLFLLVFVAAFCCLYRKYFWQEPEARRLFWWTVFALAGVCLLKFVIYYFAKGYVPDRALFYALPSPKFSGVLWLVPIALSLGALWHFKHRFALWPAWRFLLTLWCIFSLFSIGVGGIREGAQSIVDPFTRSELEYTGYLPHIQNIGDFLRGYAEEVSDPEREFADHSKTHPPGYVLILYLLQKLFNASLIGLTFLVTSIGGLCIFPVYYFWKQFLPEEDVRGALSVFIFVPSLVMFSATSMDIMTPVFFWLALAVSTIGWKKGWAVAFLGGILSGVALLMNFLFLAFGAVFMFFFLRLLRQTPREARGVIAGRALWSLVGFAGFFLALELGTGYSIIENFFAAQSVHGAVVASGASSAVSYVLFAGINIVAFFLYLGIPHGILFVRHGIKTLLVRDGTLLSVGFYAILIFVLSGLFQGEVERIWLFLTPLFVLPIYCSIQKSTVPHLAVISLLIFQIVTMQTLFYTYW